MMRRRRCGEAGNRRLLGDSPTPYRLVFLDGHIHSLHSDGTGDVAQIKRTAVARGLEAVIVTDHCSSLTREKWDSLRAETEAASDASFLALLGFEVTGSEGMLNRDHILAYGAPHPFVDGEGEVCAERKWPSEANPAGYGTMRPVNLARWVAFIHEQGGLAVHAHPIGTTRLQYGVDHIEVYNQAQIDDIARYAKRLSDSDEQALDFALLLGNFASYGGRDLKTKVRLPGGKEPITVEDALATAGLKLGTAESPIQSWDDLLMAYVEGLTDRPTFALANTDAHNTGDPDSKVGLAKNGLYVKNLSAGEIYDAMRAGRCFATTGPTLEFTVDDVPMGGTARIGNGFAKLRISAMAESRSAIVERVAILKNGETLTTVNPRTGVYEETLDDEISGPGYYRVEITSHDASIGGRCFAWSNPVFFRPS